MWAADGMVIPVPPSAPDYKATAAFCSMAGSGLATLCKRDNHTNRAWAPVMFLHNKVRAKSQSMEIIQQLSHEAFGPYRCSHSIPDVAAVPNALNLQMSIYEATSSDVGSRGLRQARDAYNEVAERLTQSMKAAWESGFATAGAAQ